MNVVLIEHGVDDEGSDVIAVLDHPPTQEELMGILQGQYAGCDAYCDVSVWTVNGSRQGVTLTVRPNAGKWV